MLKYTAFAALAWILISIVTFFISAQTAPGVDNATQHALSGSGTLLTGSNVLVLGPVRMGEHAVVAAGSLVRDDVEPYTVVAGRPAKVVKKIVRSAT